MHHNLKIGSLLLRKKGIFEHTAIYLGQGKVVHTIPKTGVNIVNYEEFANEQHVNVINVEHLDVETLSSRMVEIFAGDTRYCLISKNCQHIAHYLIYGSSKSSQLNCTVAGTAVGAFLGLINEKNIWIYALLGGLTGCLLHSATLKIDSTLPALRATN
ncbi:MAG: lecithin retinol acyltransferase family protein [Thalassotalea sp.]